jgi:tetratricopeptide (TPR) repeat protein
MSYIHEALKKAQVERDQGKSAYGGIPVPRRKKSFFTNRKAIVPAVFLLLVLLAFAGYSWWDQTTEDRRQNTEDRRQNTEDSGMSSVVRRPSSESRPSSAKRKTEKRRENVAESYQKARALHRDGRLTDAGLWYEKVLSMDPGHVEALNNRGVLHLQEKNYSAARKCFEKAIRLKPDYVDPYYNLACVCAVQGQVQQGLRYLGKAISMDPHVKKWAKEDPDLEGLRGDPRFREIVFRKRVTSGQ